MTMHRLTRVAVVALATAGIAAAQDECTGAVNLPLNTATPFSTVGSTTSLPPWPCAAGGNDIWYSITVVTPGAMSVNTCGSGYDSALELFSGTCAGLTSIACNDDFCALQSTLSAPVTAGTYFLRVGGFNSSTGAGTVTANLAPPATNDECTTALVLLANTPTGFDNSTASTGVETFACSTGGSPHTNDIWYRYTATSNQDIAVSLCGSAFDTLLQAYSGICGGLNSLACSDDSCALQSTVQFPGVNGQTYYIQVAGWNGSFGSGTIQVTEVTAPAPCNGGISTVGYIGGNFGNPGGAIYFNLTVSAAVSLGGLHTNFTAVAGTPVGVTVYTTPSTHVGNEGNFAAWTQVAMDNGTAVAAGNNLPTSITFATPLNLSAGTYGIALVASASTPHGYTNGNGTNQNFSSGVFSIAAGSATNVPFTAPVFTPRVWNGQLCESGPTAPGTNYCIALPNSTGVTGLISASGSNVVASNDLTFEASRLPNDAFGYFLTSAVEAVTPNPNGSQGILCLGGQIGRFRLPGEVQSSGSTGSLSLLVNLSQFPTRTGFVAVMPGETRSFQCWHRDSVGGVATSNFTNGYRVTFQ